MSNYYNEIDPYCVQWLKNLISNGLIPKGDVDDRDIREVQPSDLEGYTQFHFFAGLGGWPYALRLAGWPDDRPVWTGSCPCQPFSSAARGRQHRRKDETRHLWPDWLSLIAELRPHTLFGEQTSSAGDWFDSVCADLENLDYSIGAAVLPAIAFGFDHARPRLYFVGHADSDRKSELSVNGKMAGMQRDRSEPRSVPATNGLSPRMAQLRAAGNAIVPQVAAEFIKATMTLDDADQIRHY